MNENIDDLIANVMDSFDISHNPFSQNVPRHNNNNNNNHLPSNPNMRYVNQQYQFPKSITTTTSTTAQTTIYATTTATKSATPENNTTKKSSSTKDDYTQNDCI